MFGLFKKKQVKPTFDLKQECKIVAFHHATGFKSYTCENKNHDYRLLSRYDYIPKRTDAELLNYELSVGETSYNFYLGEPVYADLVNSKVCPLLEEKRQMIIKSLDKTGKKNLKFAIDAQRASQKIDELMGVR